MYAHPGFFIAGIIVIAGCMMILHVLSLREKVKQEAQRRQRHQRLRQRQPHTMATVTHEHQGLGTTTLDRLARVSDDQIDACVVTIELRPGPNTRKHPKLEHRDIRPIYQEVGVESILMAENIRLTAQLGSVMDYVEHLSSDLLIAQASLTAARRIAELSYFDPMIGALADVGEPLPAEDLAMMGGLSPDSAEFHGRVLDGIKWGILRAKHGGDTVRYYVEGQLSPAGQVMHPGPRPILQLTG